MQTSQPTNDEIRDALQSSDANRRNRAFKSLYMSQKVNATVRDWAQFYNLRSMTTDDVLQEAIIKLDEMIRTGKFRFEAQVSTFLLGICKNVIRDSVKKVQRVVFKEEIRDADLADAEHMADSILIEEATEATERRDDALTGSMRELGEGCEEALKLYYVEKMSMAQLAETAEKSSLSSADQAKKKVHRCRERLREAIQKNPYLAHILNPRQ